MHRDFMDLAIRNALTEPGGRDDARHRRRPRQGRHRLLRRRRHRRPPLQVGVLLPDHPAARRRHEVRAVHQRPHRLDGQPARQPQGQLPDRVEQPRRPRRSGWPRRPRSRAAGGTTTSAGSPSAAARSATSRAGSARRRTSRSATPRAPMSSTAEPTAGCARPVRTVAVRGIQARVSVRPGDAADCVDEPPLLLCNGIGASLEALQPLVDALDPDRGVIRFDVPGVGGSPLPPLPYPIAGAVVVGHRADGQARSPRVRRAGAVVGRRARPAARRPVTAAASAGWCWSPPAPAR